MIYLSALEYVETTRATEKDIFFTFFPLFHANARILCIYPTLLLGTKAVIYEKFSASRFWDQVRKHKATMFNSLGAIGQFIYNQPRKPDDWGQSDEGLCCLSYARGNLLRLREAVQPEGCRRLRPHGIGNRHLQPVGQAETGFLW